MAKEPFIKVVWEDTPENVTVERVKRVKKYFETKYNTTRVRIVPKILSNSTSIKLKSLETSDNILDLQYQKKLVKDFITENDLKVDWNLINRLDDKVNADSVESDKMKYSKWVIKRIEFSNLLSFGDGNVIDFTNINGITVVESNPPNFGGKTTATVDLLLFLFFGVTTKTKTIIEIFNRFSDKDEVNVKGFINIDDIDYLIIRKLIRKQKRSGSDYTVKSILEFYSYDGNGDPVNLSDEQRRETEKIIKSAIGTQEDFLSTILTTGNNLEELIESKPTARGQILTKFLGLENLKEKEEICKKKYTEWSKGLWSNTHNVTDLKEKNESFKTDILTSETEIKRLENFLVEVELKLKTLEENRDKLLGSKNNDINDELMKINPMLLEKEIENLKSQKLKIEITYRDLVVTEPSEYYVEEDHEILKKQIQKLLINNTIESNEIKNKEATVKQFVEGTVCPTCKQKLADVDHTDEIKILEDEIIILKEKLLENSTKLKSLNEKELVFSKIKTELDNYETSKLKKSKSELEVSQKETEIENRKTKIEYFNSNKKKMEENQRIDREIIAVRTQLETANADIRTTSINIEKQKGYIVSYKEKISTNEEIIKKIKIEEEYLPVFKTYLMIFGKNGISKVIMKNMIPLLNEELYRILSDTTHFTLELNINDKNELEFYMIDNETRVTKPLSSGSGYEKTVSSLAIRSVLTKVSSLPKPNIVVMDEIFGKIADDNLELVGEFFVKIKKYFEHILVISHNPLIRNWSDNLIMVKKDKNISYIENVTSKN